MIPLKSRVYFVDSLKGIILRFVFFLNLNRFGELVSDDKYRLKKYKPFISPNNNNILMYVTWPLVTYLQNHQRKSRAAHSTLFNIHVWGIFTPVNHIEVVIQTTTHVAGFC